MCSSNSRSSSSSRKHPFVTSQTEYRPMDRTSILVATPSVQHLRASTHSLTFGGVQQCIFIREIKSKRFLKAGWKQGVNMFSTGDWNEGKKTDKL